MPETMTREAEPSGAPDAGLPAVEDTLFRLRQAVQSGRHWFDCVLDAVRDWRAAEEWVGDRHFRYLIAGEAFDWLLLAERLALELQDLVPAGEVDALLFDGKWPLAIDDAEFAERVGPAKFSAHLNYLYGVQVEEALQLHVEEEMWKEAFSRAWGLDPRIDESMYERVYSKDRQELQALYYEATGTMLRERVSLTEWKSFTYWLFRYRMKWQDKARVASDTRKGLAQLTKMELLVNERRRGVRGDAADFAARFGAFAPTGEAGGAPAGRLKLPPGMLCLCGGS
ncbi:MAG: hypothetical protein ACKVVT_00310 [Dehalococcoidia bacterium]